MDSSGAIYGTAQSGGSWLNQGLVFKLTPPAPGHTQWTETVLQIFYHSYAFGADDGANPSGGLIMDKNGALYGTTDLGGSITDPSGIGLGTVFKLTPPAAGNTAWTELVLHSFTGPDGAYPQGGLIMDGSGALIGNSVGRWSDQLRSSRRLWTRVQACAAAARTTVLDRNSALQLRYQEQWQ